MTLTKATPDVLSKAYVEKTDDTENVLGGSLALTEAIFTINSGAITPTRSNIVLAAEGGTTTDMLDQIVTTSLSDDTIIILSVDAGHTITINHAGGAAGQIHLIDDSDFVMSGNERLCLIRDNADWYELSRAIVSTSQTIVQAVHTQTGAVGTTTGTSVIDDSIPTLTEVPINAALDTTITPTSTSNRLLIEVTAHVTLAGAATYVVFGIFQDAGTSAIAATSQYVSVAGVTATIHFSHEKAAGTVSSTTFKVGAGSSNGNSLYWNGAGGSRLLGGVSVSSMRITELTP